MRTNPITRASRSIAGAIAIVILALALPIAVFAQGLGLIDSERARALKSILPVVEDKSLQEVFKSSSLVLYDDDTMPPGYQDWEGASHGIFSPKFNISAFAGERTGNANLEFPWQHPFGTERVKNLKKFRFLYLPLKDDGTRWPIVWYRQNPYRVPTFDDRGNGRGFGWTFPVGTIVGEVLLVESAQKEVYVFEIRTRERRLNRWFPNVYRPFPTVEDLLYAVGPSSPDPSYGFTKSLLEPSKTMFVGYSDIQPRIPVIRTPGRVKEYLPDFDEGTVARLLSTTTFKSAFGREWRPTGTKKAYGHAPSSRIAFNIVPAEYTGAFVSIDSESCMQCHKTTNMHAREFDLQRHWYGRVRGSDGIFSIYPWTPESVSRTSPPVTIQLNKNFSALGIFAPYNKKIHPSHMYASIQGLL